jgi:hypothetical protein
VKVHKGKKKIASAHHKQRRSEPALNSGHVYQRGIVSDSVVVVVVGGTTRTISVLTPLTARALTPFGSRTARALAPFGSRTAGTLAPFSARTAGTLATFRTRTRAEPTTSEVGTQFFLVQFAVAVLVQLLQRSGGVGNFFFRQNSVTVGIQRGENREASHEVPGSAGAASFGSRSTRATSFGSRSAFALRTGTAGGVTFSLGSGAARRFFFLCRRKIGVDTDHQQRHHNCTHFFHSDSTPE